MEYIKIENGKVTGHFSSKEMPKGKEYRKVIAFGGFVGCDFGMLNSDGSVKSEEELISLGFIKDNRGDYFNIENKSKITISQIGIDIPEKYTSIKPKQFDEWDGSKWIENTNKKLEYEKNINILEAKEYLNSTDYKVIKSIEQGKSINDLYPNEAKKREEAREIIRNLK